MTRSSPGGPYQPGQFLFFPEVLVHSAPDVGVHRAPVSALSGEKQKLLLTAALPGSRVGRNQDSVDQPKHSPCLV